MRFFQKILLYCILATTAFSHAYSAKEKEADIAVPKDINLPSEFNLVQIDTTPLPELKRQVPIVRPPADALMDAFGLPMFVPIKKNKDMPGDIAGGEIGRIVNRLAINGILPNQEAIIETYIVPLGGTFAVKIKEKEIILLHIKAITDTYIEFGWSKDETTYHYMLPEKQSLDIYIEEQNPQKIKEAIEESEE